MLDLLERNIQKTLLLYILLSCTFLYASIKPVNANTNEKTFLLAQSEILVSPVELSMEEVTKNKIFEPFHKKHLNLGITKDHIYIHFTLQNNTGKPVKKIISANSPLLENVILYTEDDLQKGMARGILNIDGDHTTIPFYFPVTIPPKSIKEHYLKIHSTYNAINFTLTLENKEQFQKRDRMEQAVNLLLIGMVIALMLYSFFLSYYIDDRSYFFYSLYLFTLIYQQITYLGLTQIYFPRWFVLFDLYIDIIKLTLLIITAALFAMHFIETKRYPGIHRIYQAIIVVVFLELLFLPPEETYGLLIVILSGAFFIFFNLFSGIYAYTHGVKQARLFIFGFSIVSLFYIIMILDTLGFTSLMFHFQNALIWGTALEAFILSLAFADRYLILQKEKKKADEAILHETQHRAALIEKEVIDKTHELNRALETKDLLIQEIHHRVKNNLQIILSIIRLQNLEVDDPKTKEKLTDLEYRINAIAKTYTLLLNNENLEEVNMQAYIETLLIDISESYDYIKYNIDIITDIDATIPIKASVYVGLIINELVTNSYKHAFENGSGSITIRLKEAKKHYTLTFEDTGKGFVPDKQHRSLGLKLIHTLVQDQLGGTIEMNTNGQTQYIIKFSL